MADGGGFKIASAFVEVETRDNSREGFARVRKSAEDFSKSIPKAGVEVEDETKAGLDKAKGSVGAWAAGMAGIALAAGAALTKGLTDGLDATKALTKMNTQLGASGPLAKELGKVAGDLYSDGYGDSMETVAQSVKAAWQNGIIPEDATVGQIKAVTGKMMSVSDAFGGDIAATAKAVGQMLKTGIAKNADEALDILARGMQQGANASGDLLDTFNEYPVQFQKLGLSGSQAMGLINQAIKAGARDSDVAADAIKEFSIRAVDGSKLSAEGYKALNLNAKEMTAEFAKGGTSASTAFNTVLKAIQQIDDPVKKSAAQVALFGTQSEDLGAALNGMDLDTAAESLGKVAGAAGEIDKQMGEDPSAKFEKFKRSLTTKISGFAMDKVVPVLEKFGKIIQNPILPLVEKFGGWLSKYSGWLIPIASGFAAIAGAVWLYNAAVSFAATVQAAWNAVMMVNPLGLFILAIVGLIAIFAVAWKTSETFRDVVKGALGAVAGFFAGLWNGIKSGWNAFKNFLSIGWAGLWNGISSVFSKIWASIGAEFRSKINNIKNLLGWFSNLGTLARKWFTDMALEAGKNITNLLNTIKGLPGKIGGYFKAAGTMLKDVGKKIIQGLIDGIKEKFNDVKDTLGSLTDKMTSWKGPEERDRKLLTPAGEMIIDSLTDGFDNKTAGVKKKLQALTGEIQTSISLKRTGTASGSQVPGASSDSDSRIVNIQNLVLQIAGNLDPTDPIKWEAAIDAIRQAIRGLERRNA